MFVKDNNICFKCCEIISYIRRLCKRDIKCIECDSVIYFIVLYFLLLLLIMKFLLVYGGEVIFGNLKFDIEFKCI